MPDHYKKNRSLLVEHFVSAAKCCTRCLGLELEHFVLRSDGSSAEYLGEHGVRSLLNDLLPYAKEAYYVDGRLLGLYGADYSISLEPSSQLEISVNPKCGPDEIGKTYGAFTALLAPILKKHGLHLAALGYRPSGSVYDLPLIPKKRYEYMDRYFKTSGHHGISMMRGTASTQVSVDYSCERDFIEKYRFAYLLMPALKLICDNTPVYEDSENKLPLRRTLIWRDVDNARCLPPENLFDIDFGYGAYADYLMHVPLIFLPTSGGFEYVGGENAAELFADRLFSDSDIDHVLSMVFPDVRLKSYIEIRGADSLPIDEALGYTALIKALFYTDGIAGEYLSKYKISYDDITAAEDSIMQNGRRGMIYGESADAFIEGLFAVAQEKLKSDEAKYLKALETHAAR